MVPTNKTEKYLDYGNNLELLKQSLTKIYSNFKPKLVEILLNCFFHASKASIKMAAEKEKESANEVT